MEERLTRKEVLVFDIGNVLLRFDADALAPFFLPDECRQALMDVLFHKDGDWARFDLGEQSNEQIALDAARKAGVPGGEKYVLDMLLGYHLYMPPLPLTRELPALKTMGKRLYLLTNYPEPSFTLARARYDFFPLFDGFVCSARERLVKPDPHIFRLLCRRYAFAPEQALFIDDNAANIASAAALGFDTWHYTDF